ncbi:hypothetical protein M758_12G020300 [Ceratodon purpureus]|nr:hypothetical protein M758_12G020300 [Ceratodon purpureus]
MMGRARGPGGKFLSLLTRTLVRRIPTTTAMTATCTSPISATFGSIIVTTVAQKSYRCYFLISVGQAHVHDDPESPHNHH